MLSYQWLEAAEEYLNNLKMFKYLHDCNIDITAFGNSCLSSFDYYGDYYNTGFNLLIDITEWLFDSIEVYRSYDEEDVKHIQFWLKECNYDYTLSEMDEAEIIVIMDDSLINPIVGSCGGTFYSASDIDIEKIDGGVVVIFDPTAGPYDYFDVLVTLIKSKENDIERMKE